MTVQKTSTQPLNESAIKLDNVLFISSDLEEADKRGKPENSNITKDLSLEDVSYVNVGGEPFRVTAKGITPIGIQSETYQSELNDDQHEKSNQPAIEYDYIEAHFSKDAVGFLPYNTDIQVKQNPDFSDGFLVPIDCIEFDPESNKALVTESFETVIPYGMLVYEDGGSTNFASAPIWVSAGTELQLQK